MASRGTSLRKYCEDNPNLIHLLEEFDYSRNNFTPDDITCKNSRIKVHWYCKKCDHHWQELCYNRVNYPTPPCCSGKHPTKINNLAYKYPELMKDWDYEENKDIDPYKIVPGSHINISWKCHVCGHKWSTKLYSRTQQLADCPNCSKAQTSKSERMILEYMKQTFPNAYHQKEDRKGTPELDVVIPEIRVAIEYDGYPWHVDEVAKHTKKLQYCNERGYTLINIAEFKNTEEIKQAVKAQYTPEHRVIYLDVTGAYNRDKVLDEIYKYFVANGVKSLTPPTKEFKDKLKQDVRLGTIKNNLWNDPDYQWLHNWIVDEQSIKYAKAYSHGSAEVKIKLTCPNCGRTIKKTPHYITRKFVGCTIKGGGCSCQDYIPKEHIEKVRSTYK